MKVVETLSLQFAKQLENEVPEFSIQFQPEVTCCLSENLKRVLATEQQQDALATLSSLRSLNNQFVGELSSAALAALEHSEELWLESELAWDWIRRYLTHRIAKPNPKDELSPLRKFERIALEVGENILVPHFSVPYAAHLLQHSLFSRSVWFLFLQLLDRYTGLSRPRVKGERRPEIVAALNADDRIIDRMHLIEILDNIFTWFSWHTDYLPPFLNGLLSGKSDMSPIPESEMKSQASALAADIRELRSFVGGSKPGSIAFKIGSWWVGVKWIAINGLCELHLGESEASMLKSVKTSSKGNETYLDKGATCRVLLRYDGVLADAFRPDLTIFDHHSHISSWNSCNLEILNALRERLLESFTKIDFKRFRASDDASEDSVLNQDRVLALTMFEIESNFGEPESSLPNRISEPTSNGRLEFGTTRLGCMRLSKLAPILARFDCEIVDGKGSEQKVYRRGFSFFTIKRHFRDPEVPKIVVKRLIRHFDISIADFRSAAIAVK